MHTKNFVDQKLAIMTTGDSTRKVLEMGFTPGMALTYRCKSDPQMAVEVTFRTASSCTSDKLSFSGHHKYF